MIVLGSTTLDAPPVPLAEDEELWARAIERLQAHLEQAARGGCEPAPAALAAACGVIRRGGELAPVFLALIRRTLVRTEIGSETALRCLRVLARAGEAIDVRRLTDTLQLAGRPPRIALVSLAELASRGDRDAMETLVEALGGGLRNEAAQLLSHIATPAALDALSKHLRTPGPTGVSAASALVAVEDDPFAFEVLCERLCEEEDGYLAGRALWGAAPNGERVLAAESVLSRWARRGVKAAEHGQWMAAAFLTAGKITHDVSATLRALHSDNDEVVLLGAQAAYAIGDAERARGALLGLFRRGPTLAFQAFQVLSRWADVGDGRAYLMLRTLLERRPIDLSRAAIFEGLASTTRPALRQVVSRGVASNDRITSFEACRALTRLREPPSIVPPLWM